MKKELHILFVSFIGDLKNSTQGFIKKDLEKVDALNSLDGVTCKGVTFAYNIHKDYYYNPILLVKKLTEQKTRKYFNSLYKNKYEHEQLDLFLSQTKFDVILSRYNVSTWSLYKLIKKHKNKIIFEHNSFEYDELKLGINGRRSLLRFSLKPGYLIYYFIYLATPS